MKKLSSTSHPSCVECCFYVTTAAGCGDCHRYPPVFQTADHSNERHHWKHPKVHEQNWCGEFGPRPKS